MTRRYVADDLYGQLCRRLEEVARRVDEGTISFEATMSYLQLIVEGRFPANGATTSFPVWRTFTVGGVDVQGLQRQLKDGGFYVSDWAHDIMGKPAFKTSAELRKVSFVREKVADLGFTTMPTTRELFDRERLAQFNLDLCEAEDGPHLRLALADQPRGEWFWVAMEPITDSHGNPHVFYVERLDDGKQWLNADYAVAENHWSLDSTVVFRPRK